MFDLIHYADADGKDHFGRWLESLSDVQAQARVSARLIRLHRGNFGDCRAVGEGVWEIRIDWGPGYRVYYAIAGKQPSCFAREVISVPRLQTFNEPSDDGRIGSKGGRDE